MLKNCECFLFKIICKCHGHGRDLYKVEAFVAGGTSIARVETFVAGFHTLDVRYFGKVI